MAGFVVAVALVKPTHSTYRAVRALSLSRSAAAMRAAREPIGPGEESCWDYPRPPRLELANRRVKVFANGKLVADSTGAYRILETYHPPTYYIPRAHFDAQYLEQERATGSSFCEFKGKATYWSFVVDGKRFDRVAWSYEAPSDPQYKPILGHLAVYAGRVDECQVDGEKVVPQEGGFYGGWINSWIKGPFKGAPGTNHW
ncbi:hypothetical protein FVE85_7286 [Porphyridium purpureum]|uniref:DUF427 domain-containing protein n=1 Tax=Porphyridium purpureum TaxID=35688 RepID=A0A5J4Z708_PORPP|nr:hypothetical protein FVE85_7286 [Porphyridium purpureum]|eukprot:POR8310..scf295_1